VPCFLAEFGRWPTEYSRIEIENERMSNRPQGGKICKSCEINNEKERERMRARERERDRQRQREREKKREIERERLNKERQRQRERKNRDREREIRNKGKMFLFKFNYNYNTVKPDLTPTCEQRPPVNNGQLDSSMTRINLYFIRNFFQTATFLGSQWWPL
jgi:hypothetical protein